MSPLGAKKSSVALSYRLYYELFSSFCVLSTQSIYRSDSLFIQKKLRPVKREDEDARRNTYDPKDKSVQAILMRRFALEMSDDEDGSDDGGSSDGWSD